MRSLDFLALAAFTAVTQAQALQRQVLSTFIYTTYGDRTPFALPRAPVLTPLGAQQMYEAGQNIRAHYIDALAPEGSTDTDDLYSAIRRISPYQLPADQITVATRDEQYISAGASAFMQGLYPPLESNSNYTFIVGQSAMANGSNIVAPLSGYQYPRLRSYGQNDYNHVYLDGSANCPEYTKSGASYFDGSSYKTISDQNEAWYKTLIPGILEGVLPESDIGYFDAWTIYDYLNYMNNHNSSVGNNLASEDLVKARILATNWVFAMNGNTSSSGAAKDDQVGVIAGRALASRITQSFQHTISTEGNRDKMTLLFGSFEPMIAFSALAGLNVEQHSAFLNLPAPGSSYIFELFSLQANTAGPYPSTENIYVRFLHQNGTGPSASLIPYPLFSHSPSTIALPLSTFLSSLSQIAIPSIASWCETCGSSALFCPDAFPSRSRNSGGGGLKPAVAGVIGALVALVVVGAVGVLVAWLLGVRVQRVKRGRRSELGGFKGKEKLGSDRDLTLPKGGAGVGVVEHHEGTVDEEAGDGLRGGHERVGSWELREQEANKDVGVGGGVAGLQRPETAKVGRRPSYEDDDDDELNVHAWAKGVRPEERV